MVLHQVDPGLMGHLAELDPEIRCTHEPAWISIECQICGISTAKPMKSPGILPTNLPSRGIGFRARLPPQAHSCFMKIPTTPSIRRRQGFTLLEMVIVLGIIAMILGGAIFAMRGIGDAAKLKQVDADFKSLESALQMYKLNAGSYPTSQQGLKSLQEKPSGTPVPRRWVQVMSKVPLDPWDSPYTYRFPGRKRVNEFEILSKGPDGMENTADDLSSQDD
jgi:general secretion pathway protein G